MRVRPAISFGFDAPDRVDGAMSVAPTSPANIHHPFAIGTATIRLVWNRLLVDLGISLTPLPTTERNRLVSRSLRPSSSP
jgi:hypothetical protein